MKEPSKAVRPQEDRRTIAQRRAAWAPPSEVARLEKVMAELGEAARKCGRVTAA